MTHDGDSPPPTPLAPEDTPPAGTPPLWRRLDWRAQARRLGAEYLIVVLGVLTAVGINAWWSDRQHDAREALLLRQIVEDLRITELRMTEHDAINAPFALANARLLRAFSREAVPPADSILAWQAVASQITLPEPELTSVEALLEGGDRVLAEAPELRSEIAEYLFKSLFRVRLHRQASESFVAARGRIEARFDGAEVTRSLLPAQTLDSLARHDPYFIDAPGDRVAFPFDPSEVVRDREAYNSLRTMHRSHGTLRDSRELWRAWSRELRERIQARLGA